jgi:CO/xanthine dehydrogenase FAD-binding subunit
MNAFAYRRVSSISDALTSIAAHHHGKYLGGGTNLVDLMKMGVEQPAALIDVTRPSACGHRGVSWRSANSERRYEIPQSPATL